MAPTTQHPGKLPACLRPTSQGGASHATPASCWHSSQVASHKSRRSRRGRTVRWGQTFGNEYPWRAGSACSTCSTPTTKKKHAPIVVLSSGVCFVFFSSSSQAQRPLYRRQLILASFSILFRYHSKHSGYSPNLITAQCHTQRCGLVQTDTPARVNGLTPTPRLTIHVARAA